jgi:hypothetical protein
VLRTTRYIDLLRTLSNPETGVTLNTLVSGLPPYRERCPTPHRLGSRARHGIVRQTCAQVVFDQGKPITVREIHAGTESILDCSVSYSSVKNAVAGPG